MLGSDPGRVPSGVTLDNWQESPHLHWSFQHIADLFPDADRSPAGSAPWPTCRGPLDRRRRRRGRRARGAPLALALAAHGAPPAHGRRRDGLDRHRRLDRLAPRVAARRGVPRRHGAVVVAHPHVGEQVPRGLGRRRRWPPSGVLDLDAPLSAYVPALGSSGYAGATVRHLLDMRSGIKFSEVYLDPRRRGAHHRGGHRLGAAHPRRRADDDVRLPAHARGEGSARRPVRLPLVRDRRARLGARGRVGHPDERPHVRAALEPHRRGVRREHRRRLRGRRDVRRRHQRGAARPRALRRDDGQEGVSLTGARVLPASWVADCFAGGPDSREAFAASESAALMPGGMYRNQFWAPSSRPGRARGPRHPRPDGLRQPAHPGGRPPSSPAGRPPRTPAKLFTALPPSTPSRPPSPTEPSRRPRRPTRSRRVARAAAPVKASDRVPMCRCAAHLPRPRRRALGHVTLAESFTAAWPSYRAWFLREGEAARPSYAESRAALAWHMPELLATYDALCAAIGGGDLEARFLSHWCPPPVATACSLATWTRDAHLLVRSYDYPPLLCDTTVLASSCTGTRVLAMADCLWGAVDGINAHGLAVALAFGGRPQVVGPGFGIGLVVRYLLEVARDVAEAVAILSRAAGLDVLQRRAHRRPRRQRRRRGRARPPRARHGRSTAANRQTPRRRRAGHRVAGARVAVGHGRARGRARGARDATRGPRRTTWSRRSSTAPVQRDPACTSGARSGRRSTTATPARSTCSGRTRRGG